MRTEVLRVSMLSLHGHNRISLNFRFWEGAQVLDAGCWMLLKNSFSYPIYLSLSL